MTRAQAEISLQLHKNTKKTENKKDKEKIIIYQKENIPKKSKDHNKKSQLLEESKRT